MMIHLQEEPEPAREDGGSPEIELALLRRGLRRMESHRSSCCACGRCPLVGERMRVFRGADGKERSACTLCVPDESGSSLGEPVGTRVVRAGERPLAVRRAA
jgi:hypothetical protein